MENLTLISPPPKISLVSTANLNGVISIRHSSLFHLSKRPPIKTTSIRVSAHVNQGNGKARRVLSRNGKPGAPLSVEALEEMMEDPEVQKMVYPHLPEEMRSPDSFKLMLQNPQYRKLLEDVLNSMGGNSEWGNQIMDSLKNFDISSPEVEQKFDQVGVVGLTPEEVISKIMANPEVAMAFQNPKVQAAIMDISQNPLNFAKYQNDTEVMTVFNKIPELFPGVSGSPY